MGSLLLLVCKLEANDLTNFKALSVGKSFNVECGSILISNKPNMLASGK